MKGLQLKASPKNQLCSYLVKVNDPEVEAPRLEAGSPITPDTIIRDIVETYPHVVPVLQGIGMGCLGCPSATAEPLWQAAEIHGFNVYDLVEKLETARKGA